MPISMHRCAGAGLPALLLLLTGCSSAATLSGTVTYDGQPVEQGSISFEPADGKGPTAGGPITNGRYQVANLKPGRKRVLIAAVRSYEFPRTSPEPGQPLPKASPALDLIPPDAEGNNQTIEVTAGTQTQDFHLRKPARK